MTWDYDEVVDDDVTDNVDETEVQRSLHRAVMRTGPG